VGGHRLIRPLRPDRTLPGRPRDRVRHLHEHEQVNAIGTEIGGIGDAFTKDATCKKMQTIFSS
jgi:hypothetical protein